MKLFFLLFAISPFSLLAQTITGKWQSIDDETGKPRSVVEIYEKAREYSGKIVKLYRKPGEDPDPVCEECPGTKKDQKIIGMEILTGMEYDEEDGEYVNGQILDPESGNLYDCKIWLGEEGNLNVRGYLLFFFRTQIWLPYDGK